MTDNYIIETPHRAAGVVVRNDRGFLFFSAGRDFDNLDGKIFQTPEKATRAAIQHETRLKRPLF